MEQLYRLTSNIEKIKNSLLTTYFKYNGTQNPYSEEELKRAAIQIQNLFDKINNMIIYDNGNKRHLNNLEIFIEIYEFVSNRVYVEQNNSHDLIGVLITNQGVCQGYCQLMSFLCESLNIPFLYKCTETFDENNNPLGSHANFEVIVQDENGLNHCLHCDPTIDSPKDSSDILSFNALLIQDSDINMYYHKQIPSGNDISNFFNCFLSKQNFEQSIRLLTQVSHIEQMISGKSEEEIIKEHFIKLKDKLIQLNKFFKMNIDFSSLSIAQLVPAYRAMYEYYVSIAQPFNSYQLKEAIINVKASEIMYERHLDFMDALNQSQEIFNQRMKKSIELQRKYWENKGGGSLMFDGTIRENGPKMS